MNLWVKLQNPILKFIMTDPFTPILCPFTVLMFTLLSEILCNNPSAETVLSCSSQTCLRPLPVQTQGMQLLNLFIQIYYISSHQQYENVTIEVSHNSMFKNHSSCKTLYTKDRLKDSKTAGAVILQLALKLQKRNNFSVIPI